MYDGVSMDRAYSGSTLIWCKNCPGTPVVCGFERVHTGSGIIGGEDYLFTTSDSPQVTQDSIIKHADRDYPLVYESECDGYVTDLGGAFGLHMSSGPSPNNRLDHGYYFGAKQPLATYINDDRNVVHTLNYYKYDLVMCGQYIMSSYYVYDPGRGPIVDQGFKLGPIRSDQTVFRPFRVYRIIYCYQ